MKETLIIANILFASVKVFGMTEIAGLLSAPTYAEIVELSDPKPVGNPIVVHAPRK